MKKNNKFNHFVITQFNLSKFPYGNGNSKNWIQWTRDRIILFRNYCLPSLLNQTNKNFTWLIYFDSETPKEFDYFLDELRTINFVKVYLANGFEHFTIRYLDDINNLASKDEWIISTRCDNDDCLEKNAINTIQNYFIPKDEFLISLASGYTLNTQDHTLSHYYYPMSPFISLIESNFKKTLKGIYFKEHTKWDNLRLKIVAELLNKNNTSRFILHKPLWIQIVHGNNVSNSHCRGLPVIRPKDLTNFGISLTSVGQSIFKIPSYFNYFVWKIYFKSFIIRFLKNSI